MSFLISFLIIIILTLDSTWHDNSICPQIALIIYCQKSTDSSGHQSLQEFRRKFLQILADFHWRLDFAICKYSITSLAWFSNFCKYNGSFCKLCKFSISHFKITSWGFSGWGSGPSGYHWLMWSWANKWLCTLSHNDWGACFSWNFARKLARDNLG